ncbi:hypothetical protein ACWEQ0_07275 [Nocardia thailandica]|uniref:Uncharacterized protein n=1 Tax=Nocardia thailandica TaxID=257275 RepID=A0ABW6PU26_9NOCA
MYDADPEDAVLAASPDTTEEMAEPGTVDRPGGHGHRAHAPGRHTQRVLCTHGTGAWVFGFPDATVRADSRVSVRLAAIGPDGAALRDGAPVRVLGVVPHSDGTTTVRYHVGAEHNLRVLFDFVILP